MKLSLFKCCLSTKTATGSATVQGGIGGRLAGDLPECWPTMTRRKTQTIRNFAISVAAPATEPRIAVNQPSDNTRQVVTDVLGAALALSGRPSGNSTTETSYKCQCLTLANSRRRRHSFTIDTGTNMHAWGGLAYLHTPNVN